MVKCIQLNPELTELTFPKAELIYTTHALERAKEKKLPVLKTLTINQGTVVEQYPCGKLTVRLRGMLNEYDLLMVIAENPSKFGWVVITTFKNHKDDKHETFNRERVANYV